MINILKQRVPGLELQDGCKRCNWDAAPVGSRRFDLHCSAETGIETVICDLKDNTEDLPC